MSSHAPESPPVELVAARLDERLYIDPAQALERFALAEQLGDDAALAWVLDEERVDALPWSVRGRAMLVLGRSALLEGDDARAARLLSQVFPDDPGYAEAKLLQGDIARAQGKLKSAVLAYRDAWNSGQGGEGLLRIASVYDELARPENADTYLSMIPPTDRSWGEAQIGRAAAGIARQADAGEILGWLISAERPSIEATLWVPEAPHIEAAVYRSLCLDERAQQIEQEARAQEAQWLTWLSDTLLLPPSERWAHRGTGPLPSAWWAAFRSRPDVVPILARLERIEALPPSAVRDERQRLTDEQLGWILAAGVQASIERIARAAEPGRYERTLVSSRRSIYFCSVQPAVYRWPFDGEYWADESHYKVSIRSSCR